MSEKTAKRNRRLKVRRPMPVTRNAPRGKDYFWPGSVGGRLQALGIDARRHTGGLRVTVDKGDRRIFVNLYEAKRLWRSEGKTHHAPAEGDFLTAFLDWVGGVGVEAA